MPALTLLACSANPCALDLLGPPSLQCVQGREAEPAGGAGGAGQGEPLRWGRDREHCCKHGWMAGLSMSTAHWGSGLQLEGVSCPARGAGPME